MTVSLKFAGITPHAIAAVINYLNGAGSLTVKVSGYTNVLEVFDVTLDTAEIVASVIREFE